MKDNANVSILVVDDEPVITDICKRVLSREGYQVDTAENGKVAREMIYRKEYSLFLVDIRTPVFDGQELYIWMLQEKPQLTDRVIFTTGDLMEGQIQRFIVESKKSFLPKPFSGEPLKKIIRRTLESMA